MPLFYRQNQRNPINFNLELGIKIILHTWLGIVSVMITGVSEKIPIAVKKATTHILVYAVQFTVCSTKSLRASTIRPLNVPIKEITINGCKIEKKHFFYHH